MQLSSPGTAPASADRAAGEARGEQAVSSWYHRAREERLWFTGEVSQGSDLIYSSTQRWLVVHLNLRRGDALEQKSALGFLQDLEAPCGLFGGGWKDIRTEPGLWGW